MSAVKTLVVGSVNGDFRGLCSKVGAINEKNGPFDILLCTGNFFAKETVMDTIDELLENKLEFPITTYFIHGDNGVPGIIERRAARNAGEVCNNLFYLGSHGVTTTIQSVKIASLSGTYDSTIFSSTNPDELEGVDKDLIRSRYTKANIDDLIRLSKPTSLMNTPKHAGSDIFLTHEWPSGITKDMSGGNGSNSLGAPSSLGVTNFSPAVSKAAVALQPRYHFAARSGQFWERAPYRNTEGADHATRFVALGDVGNKDKQRWFYAFNMVPLSKVSDDTLQGSITATTTDSPLVSAMESKRDREEVESSMFWDTKRMKSSSHEYVCKRCNNPGHHIRDCPQPPEGYTCNKCQQQGHFIRDCPKFKEETTAPPEGYICKKCSQPGHFIRECPKAKEESSTPPEGYICKKCNQPGHYIRECPSHEQPSQPRDDANGRKELPKRDGPLQPCWFCLSNPDIDKNLIVSIGTEMYVTMAKGQLPATPSSLVPGGGHVIMITINHYPNFTAVESEARSDLNSELRKYKEGLRNLYESKGGAMVTWELSQGGKMMHAHVQSMAVPRGKAQDVEEVFRQEIGSFFISGEYGRSRDQRGSAPPSSHQAQWQEHEVDPRSHQSFFKVELPDGRILVCPIPDRQRIDMQFGRKVMAKVMDTPERVNWKSCVKVDEEERKDSVAFKNAFKSFDFTMD
ncbi:hypothetical protein BGW38_002586 [Lunasporangiospora selenospora]|uniref:CCHC-type domain-containing protein n=1 Tax=Lunasporangiospora selenospora TaxID=979761 RepID=A0A9P6KCT1_9FUNG|nr:hypothetical protein BGW38_002586 [Lunasporangiospora selenospora]